MFLWNFWNYNYIFRIFSVVFDSIFIIPRIIEESAFPPVVLPLAVQATAFDDDFPAGVIGNVHAVDNDVYDTIAFSIVSDNKHLFKIDEFNGTLSAIQVLLGRIIIWTLTFPCSII